MHRFLWKGIIRDRSRSLLPVLVVTIGVFAVVFSYGYIQGMLDNMIRTTADFQTGHLKVVTRAYLENEEQKPNDLALLEVDTLQKKLTEEFPEVEWTPRIFFGGLLDIPDSNGETKAQGPVSGTAYDLLSPGSREARRIGLQQSLVAGHVIQQSNEIIISYDFADRYQVRPGDTVTFFGSTMYGSMSFANYTVAGIVRFGIGQLDRGAVILDISDARLLLDMDNAAGELFGFLPGDLYNKEQAERVKESFNRQYTGVTDEYAPVMVQLADQDFMGQMLAYMHIVSLVMVILLVFALAIVLWNAGILSGIRRYNEFGVRLAMGEEKKHIYRTLLVESLFIGIIGSAIGTALGISLCYYLQDHGIDYSAMMDSVNMMIDPVIHARVTPELYFIGFIPGGLSMLIGSALAGTAVYKRNTAMLFKELD
ncbi:ABC transporter permease [Proteiniphilum acetatigenes]|uniref:ABC transporter permease n=1 Tax=Proteiniphilum acetatigenes TaxID=294710 RepID=UPI000477346C|nr:ABC transporter permease [Proteiniphilum acetatigenes]SFK31442.1 putative ABC transport system permease protein [Porphyromonadaceae bacterium KH3CP3RA]